MLLPPPSPPAGVPDATAPSIQSPHHCNSRRRDETNPSSSRQQQHRSPLKHCLKSDKVSSKPPPPRTKSKLVA
ncbi:hypothetical protein ACLB2K_015434 [Fragaria x ananassa]